MFLKYFNKYLMLNILARSFFFLEGSLGSLKLFPDHSFLICFFMGFFFLLFKRIQVNRALSSKLLMCLHVSICGNVILVRGLQIYCLASRGYQSFLMTSRTRRKKQPWGQSIPIVSFHFPPKLIALGCSLVRWWEFFASWILH